WPPARAPASPRCCAGCASSERVSGGPRAPARPRREGSYHRARLSGARIWPATRGAVSMSIPIELAVLQTPIGPLSVAQGPDGLVSVDFDAAPDEVGRRLARRIGPCAITVGMHPAGAALAAYFSGKLVAPQMLAVSPTGTP